MCLERGNAIVKASNFEEAKETKELGDLVPLFSEV